MKAVMIVFNQANTERMEFIFDTLGIKGYTWWSQVQGRGSQTGEPRRGTHTWPEMNAAAMTVVAEEAVGPLLDAIRKLDEVNSEVGVRAFVWHIEQSY